MTTETTVRLDDLQFMRWYEITRPMELEDDEAPEPLVMQFLEFQGRDAVLREEGSIRGEFWPTTLLAASHIVPVAAPVEILDFEAMTIAQEAQDDDERSVRPLSPEEWRAIWTTIVGVGLFWALLLIYILEVNS